MKAKVPNFINKERCGSRITKECKRHDHKIKLVEEIKRNTQQPNFKALVLALFYYCGANIKYGFLSKTCSKGSNNMAVEKQKLVPKEATTWRLRNKNLFQRKQQHGG